MNRRAFLSLSTATFATGLPRPSRAAAAPKILLRSSWQTVNIGDIAHTPGVLALLEKHVPEANVTLWPSKLDNGVEELLRKRFPRVKFALTDADKKAALKENDFFLHGSGPSLVGENELRRWVKESARPYGVYGITLPSQSSTSTSPTQPEKLQKTVELMSGGKFAYFRDSRSLELAKKIGCKAPVMEFGPDGAFAVDLANDAPAEAFLKKHELEAGKFICCIPRLRFSPYWKMKEGAAFDAKKHARNEEMKDHDIGPLRDAITRIVTETDYKVLLCPEDKSHVELGKLEIYDRLEPSVRKKVVWRDSYWLTDEAISTYRRSGGLFGLEMHSPIMCVGNGIPALVGRFAEQTTKGFMWEDIGLKEWLFDTDVETQRAQIAETALRIATHPDEARSKTEKARSYVKQRQKETMSELRKALGLA